MKEEKFTKGNWEAQQYGDEDAPVWDVVLGSPQNGQIVIIDIDGYTDEETAANAHLIASAPDLYKAIKDYLEWGSMTSSDRQMFEHRFQLAIDKVLGK